MKYTYRKRWLSMLAFVCLVLPSAALEDRTFHNKDKSQSFSGRLTGYKASSKIVTIRLSKGGVRRFKLGLLAADDQKYVLKNQDTLAVIGGVSVSFKEIKEKSTRTKKGLIRTSTVPTHYNVTVYNRTKTPIEDLELRYSYYYCVGTLTAGGPKHTPQVANGSLVFDKLYDQDTATLKTKTIDIVRSSKKGVAPPISGGGGGGGG